MHTVPGCLKGYWQVLLPTGWQYTLAEGLHARFSVPDGCMQQRAQGVCVGSDNVLSCLVEQASSSAAPGKGNSSIWHSNAQ